MNDLLLAEQLFLLLHDDTSGKSVSTIATDAAYAGALLVDLASAGAVTLVDKQVMAHPDAGVRNGPEQHPLLTAALHTIAADKPPGARSTGQIAGWKGSAQRRSSRGWSTLTRSAARCALRFAMKSARRWSVGRRRRWADRPAGQPALPVRQRRSGR